MDENYIGAQRYLADDSCTIDSMSEELMGRLGYSKEELKERFGNSFYALIFEEDEPKVRSVLCALKEDERYTVDYRLTCKTESCSGYTSRDGAQAHISTARFKTLPAIMTWTVITAMY